MTKKFVSITKQYEVECSECGIIDASDTRLKANKEMTYHLTNFHNGGRGWRKGGSWKLSYHD
jgi:hypothetical protein